jgi:Protein of unknown function (DUF3489)
LGRASINDDAVNLEPTEMGNPTATAAKPKTTRKSPPPSLSKPKTQHATAKKAGNKRPASDANLSETAHSATKPAQLLNLLKQPNSTTITEMMAATGWQQLSVRGFLAGTIKKKLGLELMSSKAEGDERRYRIATRRGR